LRAVLYTTQTGNQKIGKLELLKETNFDPRRRGVTEIAVPPSAIVETTK
jgi:hypothetical protein